MPRTWSSSHVSRARAYIATTLPTTCEVCGQLVHPDDDWHVGHRIPRALDPTRTFDPTNWRPEHAACNTADGTTAALRRAYQAGQRGEPLPMPLRPRKSLRSPTRASTAPFFGGQGVRQSPGTSPNTHTEGVATAAPVFDPATLTGVPWLADLLDVPDDAAWPRHMSPVHPAAVGSYGVDAEEWIAAEVGVRLRWWQRLALRRQLEHDADGRLVWQTVLESTPRRAGKSTRLRAVALWRLDHPDLFGEPQLVLHTGKDLPVAKEIHRRAWPWAEQRGWTVRKAMGSEEIEAPGDGSRWIIRGKGSVYGYDVTAAMVDEAWGVEPTVADDGLEPALLERSSPQLLLTSTAHRRATPLMRRRIEAALSGMGDAPGDAATLLMVWAADPDAPMHAEATWRAASPYWSEDRRRMIAAKLERALHGEADPDAEDPDPVEGFRAQYLNVWPTGPAVETESGEPVVVEDEWDALAVEVPDGRPLVAAVEAWFADGASIAVVRRGVEDRLVVSVTGCATVAEAAALVKATSPDRCLVGKSIAGHPAFADLVVEPIGGTTRQAAIGLRQAIDDGDLHHDGGAHLARQVAALRTVPGADGPRLRSSGRADAVKAAVWAVEAAREVMGMDAPAIY